MDVPEFTSIKQTKNSNLLVFRFSAFRMFFSSVGIEIECYTLTK